MAYENYVKQTFVDYPDADATNLKKEHLDHIEDGIVALEGEVAQTQSDVTLIKQSGAPSVSAERFEGDTSGNLGADPRGGIELTISTMEFKEDGTVEATIATEKVYDGYDGDAVHGLSIYPFDPGSVDLSGQFKLSAVTITRPDGRYLQVGDFLLTEAGTLYRVASMTVDGGTITVEEYTSVKGDTGPAGKDGTNGTNGKDGYTPVKGTDYYTEAEKQELLDELAAQAGSGGVGCFVIHNGDVVYEMSETMIIYKSDKTFSEVQTAYENDAPMWIEFYAGEENGWAVLPLMSVAPDKSAFAFMMNNGETFYFGHVYSSDEGTALILYAEQSAPTGLPTGGTSGQVLTIGSDGSPVWADPVATSAEGVLFG